MKMLIPLIPSRMQVAPLVFLLLPALVFLSGCQTVRNATDRFGVDRRDVMVESLHHTQQSLVGVQETFSLARTELTDFTIQEGIPLRQRYEWLGERFVECEEAVADAGVEIQDLEEAARQFFLSWEGELFDYSDPAVRNASRIQLNETRQDFDGLRNQIKETQAQAVATLNTFRDHLYFMRHNLNEHAFAALQDPWTGLIEQIENVLAEVTTTLEATQALSESLRVN